MNLLHHYQLFLFDFDGILVNTEWLHYQAYKTMCANYGIALNWEFSTYTRYALYTATGVRDALYREFPILKEMEPNWDHLYLEKKRVYSQLLQEGVDLMPGVKEFLEALAKHNLKRCVVTHSPKEQVSLIRSQHPILETIPLWITREDYHEPKPAPECYQLAIEKMATADDQIIGFEDSPRGLRALLGTQADGVLVSSYFSVDEVKRLSQEFERKFSHIPSFSEILSSR